MSVFSKAGVAPVPGFLKVFHRDVNSTPISFSMCSILGSFLTFHAFHEHQTHPTGLRRNVHQSCPRGAPSRFVHPRHAGAAFVCMPCHSANTTLSLLTNSELPHNCSQSCSHSLICGRHRHVSAELVCVGQEPGSPVFERMTLW